MILQMQYVLNNQSLDEFCKLIYW